MEDRQMLQELEALLEALDVQVRHESLGDVPGGICTVNGRWCMFLDPFMQIADQARLCAEGIIKKADIDTLYLKPEVRRYLEQASAAAGATRAA